MAYYSKINTVFLRDMNKPKHPLIKGAWAELEFGILKDLNWEATEKIDGTNMSYEFICTLPNLNCSQEEFTKYINSEDTSLENAFSLDVHGKTESANIPEVLLNKMYTLCTKRELIKIFAHPIIDPATNKTLYISFPPIVQLFGEGYGKGIQNGQNYISDNVNFILFDIKVNLTWLQRSSIIEIANKLNLSVVPLIGYMTIYEAIHMVEKGFKSTIAQNKEYNAEGLVLKAPNGLLNRCGKRIITKIKTCDFI